MDTAFEILDKTAEVPQDEWEFTSSKKSRKKSNFGRGLLQVRGAEAIPGSPPPQKDYTLYLICVSCSSGIRITSTKYLVVFYNLGYDIRSTPNPSLGITSCKECDRFTKTGEYVEWPDKIHISLELIRHTPLYKFVSSMHEESVQILSYETGIKYVSAKDVYGSLTKSSHISSITLNGDSGDGEFTYLRGGFF